MANCVAEVTWLTGLFKELGVHIKSSVKMYCDNKATIQIAANPMFHERTKHIDIDCHFVREKIYQGMIKTESIHTRDQLADLLTKRLGKSQHQQLLSNLGAMNLFQP